MSQQIPENFAHSFGNNFYELGQQVSSRLTPTVDVISGIVGQSKSVERAGKTEAYDITTRHATTKHVDTPHSRRWIDLQDKGWADLVDELDEQKLVADPKSKYLKFGVQALNRAKDAIVYAASRGTARTGTGTQPLPAAQKIAEGGTGLTLAKLLTAKEILDAAEIGNDTDEAMMEATGQGKVWDRVCVVTSRQLTNLLGTTEIKNIDYNNVKALSDGKVDEFLGFKFIRIENLAKSGTSRFCMAWCRQAMKLGIGRDIFTSVDVLPTMNYSWQVYSRMSLGAVRAEDEGVVEIACFE